MNQENKGTETLEDIAMIAQVAYSNTGILANEMLKQKKIANDVTSATFEALSKRERHVFVNALRKEGYSQAEVGGMVNRSQSAISNYEKAFKKHNS